MRFADETYVDAKRVIDEYVERAALDSPSAEDDRSCGNRAAAFWYRGSSSSWAQRLFLPVSSCR